MNLLEKITPDFLALNSFSWLNPPLGWEPLPGVGLHVIVPGKTDYFLNPDGSSPNLNASFLWRPVTGDFVAQTYVRPDFHTTWDAGALMARLDDGHWVKLCFEKTDLGTTAAVSVVTNGISDDANGVDLTVPALWLQLVRLGHQFGLHYALDGHSWRMVRVFRLELPPTIQVGLVAQSPAGPGTTVDFLSFSVESRSIGNIRAGV